MSEKKIKEGDVVCLKSDFMGSVPQKPMTVVRVFDEKARCVFLDSETTLSETTIPLVASHQLEAQC